MKSYLSIEDVNKMKYLDMVIKESLRLYPPGPNTFREPKHDIEILGYKIPAGTPIAVRFDLWSFTGFCKKYAKILIKLYDGQD